MPLIFQASELLLGIFRGFVDIPGPISNAEFRLKYFQLYSTCSDRFNNSFYFNFYRLHLKQKSSEQ